MAINLHIGMIFLKEKELYEKTMDEIYAKDIFNQGNWWVSRDDLIIRMIKIDFINFYYGVF